MTHRSRSGGPSKKRTKGPGAPKHQRKLHNPPPIPVPGAPPPATKRSTADDDSDSDSSSSDSDADVPPATAFTSSPDDEDMLSTLRVALRDSLHSPDFMGDVQRVKGLLFERKWLELFTDPKLLDAYAGRWVPSRALAFRELMASIKDVRALFTPDEGDDGAEPRHVLSIGGGAGSELLAVAALAGASRQLPGSARWLWTGADIGDWGGVLKRIEAAAIDAWDLGTSVEFRYIEGDVLAPPAGAAEPLYLANLRAPDLTTIFFTLTELLAQSRAQTLALLKTITARTPVGGLLLVADSASDIAEFPLGKDGRTWPVYMVLDALVLKAISSPGSGWEKIRGVDSRWFRLGEGVGGKWPCKLENARYWMRLYRRVGEAE